MTIRQTGSTKIISLANKIKDLITTHENKTGSSSQKGHVQAGGAPQTIGQSLAAGTDNGYYARADHVHTVNYSNILNIPETFSPSTHNHDTLYYTKTEVDDLIEDIILDNLFLDENGNLVIGTTISGFLLSGNKNIIQSGETSTLTATAYDVYSNVVEDEPIQLFKDNVLLGIYNTDSNGQVSYTYTGNGSGEHEFIVKNGRFQSEPFPLCDALFYCKGIGSRNTDWNLVGTTTSSDDTGTTVSFESGGRYIANMPNTSSSSLYDFEPPFTLEFISLNTPSNVYLQLYDGTNIVQRGLAGNGVVANSNVKWVHDGTQIKLYVDDVLKFTDNSNSNMQRVGFISNAVATLKYKEFRIYPI